VRRLVVRWLARRLGRPVVRVLAAVVVCGVAVAVVKLLEGALLGSSGWPLRAVYVALAAGLVYLAWPVIDAARPVRRD
jgi:hypothetical protein